MFESKQTAIEQYILASVPDVTIVFENTPSPSQELFEFYIRVTVQFGDGIVKQIGGGSYRYVGIVMAQIFTKPGSGIVKATQLADMVSNPLRDTFVGNIYFMVPELTKLPDLNGWAHSQVTAPFYFDEESP